MSGSSCNRLSFDRAFRGIPLGRAEHPAYRGHRREGGISGAETAKDFNRRGEEEDDRVEHGLAEHLGPEYVRSQHGQAPLAEHHGAVSGGHQVDDASGLGLGLGVEVRGRARGHDRPVESGSLHERALRRGVPLGDGEIGRLAVHSGLEQSEDAAGIRDDGPLGLLALDDFADWLHVAAGIEVRNHAKADDPVAEEEEVAPARHAGNFAVRCAGPAGV